jgi:hypothetical protein
VILAIFSRSGSSLSSLTSLAESIVSLRTVLI